MNNRIDFKKRHETIPYIEVQISGEPLPDIELFQKKYTSFSATSESINSNVYVSKPISLVNRNDQEINFDTLTETSSSIQNEIYEFLVKKITYQNIISRTSEIDEQKELQILIKQLQKTEEIQLGEELNAEFFIRSRFLLHGYKSTMEWISRYFLNNLDDLKKTIKLLHVISHFDYDEIEPNGPLMAFSAFTLGNDDVSEYAIKAFSNWNTKSTLKFLRKVDKSLLKSKIIQGYFDEVINEIEEYGE